jgi:hypothetical protein
MDDEAGAGYPRPVPFDARSKALPRLLFLAWFTIPSTVEADESLDRSACIAAYVAAQGARKVNHLLDASQDLSRCARDECPGMIKRDCATWLDEVNRDLPSIVLSVRDAEGHDVLGVQAFVDDKPVAVDGHGLPIDPGKHAVVLRLGDGTSREEDVIATVGEKERVVTIVVRLRSNGPSRKRVTIASYVLGGIGVAGLGVGTYFGIRGAVDRSSFGCDRACAPDAYNTVNREFIAADIALGVGVAAVGAAVAWWLFSPKSTPLRSNVGWRQLR